MKPGQRIALIKKTARKLAEVDDWAEVGLTLRQFGFSWADQPTGKMYDYVVHQIENSDDARLTELNEYLFEGIDEPDIRDITGPWTPQRFKLFLSHRSEDKVFVSSVKGELQNYGIDGFIAHQDIKPTKEWVDEIIKALDTCDSLAAFITPAYQQSNWTDQEVGYCIRRRVLIIPLSFGVTPYGFMGRYQAIQAKGKNPEDIARLIFESLLNNERTKTRMAEGVVGYFEESNSWEEAKKRAYLLREIKSWSPELLRRIQDAHDSNDQISGSFGAAPVVSQILQEKTF